MNRVIGFIGSGNMGGAMIGGIIQSGLLTPEHIVASDLSEKQLETLRQKYGIRTTEDNIAVATESDLLILAIKPNIYSKVIEEIKEHVKDGVIIITIAAGQSISHIESQFSKPVKVVRTMPNTPALVGEGMTGICHNNLLSESEIEEVKVIFQSLGKAEIVDEKLMDIVTGISGSSPAYVYLFLEAMADAAVAEGMPRAEAYTFSAQAVLGAAKMVLETGEHPGKLKDQVCSPGGTTIAAVCELEEKGMRSAVISAVKACVNKSKIMSSDNKS